MFIKIRGNKICYKKIGNYKNCYVFLHGLGGNLKVWDYLIPTFFNNKVSFLSIDLLGHALSDRIEKEIRMAEMSLVIEKILDKEKIETATIVGHCFGGMIGLDFAINNQNRVKKLILINSTPFITWWMKKSIFLRILNLINISSKKEYINYEKYQNSNDFNLKRLFLDLSHVGSKSYVEISKAIIEWSNKFKIKKLTFPVLMICGKKDKILPLGKQLKLANELSNAVVKIIDSNHLIPLNKQEDLKNIIIESF